MEQNPNLPVATSETSDVRLPLAAVGELPGAPEASIDERLAVLGIANSLASLDGGENRGEQLMHARTTAVIARQFDTDRTEKTASLRINLVDTFLRDGHFDTIFPGLAVPTQTFLAQCVGYELLQVQEEHAQLQQGALTSAKARPSVVTDLEGVVATLDQEMQPLARAPRTNPQVRAAIAKSVADAHVTAPQATALLAYLNGPRTQETIEELVGVRLPDLTKLLTHLNEKSGGLLGLYGVQGIAISEKEKRIRNRIGRPLPFESTDEIEKLLNDIIAERESGHRQPLLDKKAAVEQAKIIERGVAARAVLMHRKTNSPEPPPLQTRLTDEKLAEYEALGTQAFKDFIAANYGLAVKFGRRRAAHLRSSLSFDPLLRPALKGVVRAVCKFDYGRGKRFSTYAVPWISRMVSDEIFKQDWQVDYDTGGRIISIAYHTGKLTTALQREPTPKELAKACKLSVEELQFTQVTHSNIVHRLATPRGEERAPENPSPDVPARKDVSPQTERIIYNAVEDDKMAIALIEFVQNGSNYHAAAHVLNLSVGTVRRRVRAAIKQLGESYASPEMLLRTLAPED